MKPNLFLTIAFIGASTFAMAQKPTEGSASSLEVQLNLTGDVNTVAAPGLRYRYFIAPNMAIRLGFGISTSKDENNFTENSDGTGGTGTQTITSGGWMVAPGFEYHFPGTDRLSPYLGLSIGIGGGKYEEEDTNTDGTSYVDGYAYNEETPFSTFGVGLLAGTDFYFAQNFFVGAEFGFTTNTVTQKEGTATETFDGTTTTMKSPEGKSSSMDIAETAAIRLGWRF